MVDLCRALGRPIKVTAMQLKRDRVRPYVWGRVTARFNAIAENCAGVWKL